MTSEYGAAQMRRAGVAISVNDAYVAAAAVAAGALLCTHCIRDFAGYPVLKAIDPSDAQE